MARDISNRVVVRRQILTLLLALCVLGHTQAQHDAPQQCLGRNPFLRYLKRHDVQVFDTPLSASSKICVGEWTSHSTCCDGKSLADYAEKDIKKLGQDIKDVKKDVMKVKDFMKDNKDKIKKTLKKSKLKEKEREEFLDKLNKDLEDFYGEVKSVFGNENRVDDERDDCFDRIIQIRTSSMCFVCSGRAADFLLKGHIKLTMEDCRKTIDKCGDTWRKSIDLVDAIVLAKKIRKQLKEVIPKDELMDFEDNEIERFRDWIGSEHLRGPIKECDGKAKDCSESSAKLLCETFISFRKKGFLEELGEMIEHHHPVNGLPNQMSSSKGQKNGQPQPQVSQPQVSQPQVSQPQVSQPQVSQPQVSQPEVSQPQVSQPQVSQPSSKQASKGNPSQDNVAPKQNSDNSDKKLLKKLADESSKHAHESSPKQKHHQDNSNDSKNNSKSNKNKNSNWKLGKSRLLQFGGGNQDPNNMIDPTFRQDYQIDPNGVSTSESFYDR